MIAQPQLEFFQELCALFEPSQVKTLAKGGRVFQYINARMVMNRLDEIAGPTGWYPEYRVNDRGVTCRLFVRTPDEEGNPHWSYKEDGGGFAGMASEEDDEKSGYSDALKRASAAWGIGRYLYRDGVPMYLGNQEPPPLPGRPAQTATPAPQARPPAPSGANADRGVGRAPAPTRAQGASQYDNFAPPTRAGKAAFAWMKGLEEHFGTGIVAWANTYAKHQGYPFRSNEWDEQALADVAWAIVDWLKTWEQYQGEFDHLEDPRNP